MNEQQPYSVAMTDEQIKSIALANGHPCEEFYVAFMERDLIWFARRLLLQSSPTASSAAQERDPRYIANNREELDAVIGRIIEEQPASGHGELPEPVAYIREWQSDDSDLGQMLVVGNKDECDDDKWEAVYTGRQMREYALACISASLRR